MRDDARAQLDFVGDASVIGGAVEALGRLEAQGADLLLQPKAAQGLHRIGRHLDACADPGEGMRLFVDRHLSANAAQGGRTGQPAHARANDCYPQRL